MNIIENGYDFANSGHTIGTVKIYGTNKKYSSVTLDNKKIGKVKSLEKNVI